VAIRFGLGDDGRLLSAAAVGTGNAVAKDIRLAEMLIARRAVPDPATLADPAVPLKTLLRQAPS
jgi:3-phenylpropionate/trans-cinnamate dioxygenase ferredoxin reductase subunit